LDEVSRFRWDGVAVSLSAGSEADGLAAGILLDATVHALEELQIEVVTWRVGQS